MVILKANTMTIHTDYDLTPLHTFHLPARAAYFYTLDDAQKLPEICRFSEFNPETVLWLGGGSNILFTQDYSGLVVHIANKGITYTPKGKQVWVQAQAGEIWHDFVQTTIQQGLSGLENLSLIPGTVGAAPVQNIGAYGVEVKDRIVCVHCFDLHTQTFIELSQQDCQFAYRESLFKQAGKGRYVITAVTFALDTQFQAHVQYGDLAQTVAERCGHRMPTAQDVAAAVCHIRQQKLPDPKILGNAGSFYKNPIVSSNHAADLKTRYPNLPTYPQTDGTVKLAAGWLIDQCGLKGHQIGGAAVHQKQALVLVNQNQASADDVRQLSHFICQTVLQKFGVQLETEPNWI